MTTVIFSTWKIYLTYSGQELLPVTAGASNFMTAEKASPIMIVIKF